MTKGLTWADLQEALKGYPRRLFDGSDFDALQTTVRACQAAGRPLEVDIEAAEAMHVVLQIAPLNTRFLLHKFSRGRGLLFERPPAFLVCTGKLTEDHWDMHLPGVSREAAMRAVVRPFEWFEERARMVVEGQPLSQ